MTDTVPVRFEVLGVERLTGAGRVVALANVLVEVAGVSFELQGLRVVKEARGIGVETPQFRHPRDGRYLPTVILPPELFDPIGREVLEALAAGR